MRLRHDKTAITKLNESTFFIKDFPIKVKDTDVIEIGAGKGEMISQLAKSNPDTRYFALEKYPTVANKILKKINDLKLSNLFIIAKDANELPNIFEGRVNKIWLTFSDPWPKNAHEKRRLTYKTFLDLYKNLLTESGQLLFKTDNDKLFEFSVESLNQNNWNIIDLTTNLHDSKYNETNFRTGYEEKWSSLGKNINFLIAEYKK
ncbi:tRNA (guanine-N(7)-)-methyltransferase [Mycoplasmopsis canis UFG4]|uniref:tRNA (guanine-N(7)-)-methyltransferase n=1 Tax=Mycoplasmopsis canis UFG4 TaxID=1131455 RepID=I1A5N1_9BACT|nr:tRNA (guanosine(46)-N7)-methyltransferase TrmB [Mycoplasmopsis canis]EIE41802.1 tRNA (guanine-N(7)-)-methyltransferase [Mycoplasmopsis canis UFG4]